METSREQHLQWAKQRALQVLEYYGSPSQALISLSNDLMKHSELRTHAAIELGTQLFIVGKLGTVAAMRKFIEDCS
ncbi:hypothetical protein NIES2100_21240 [Calothrix sp. NIES-2100]|nr:hypothetical protein NIES2100_21240 [Calothrix sp. NIES-2100]